MAVSIPIFTAQLEKAREATDEANLRSLYAEVFAAVLSEDTDYESSIKGASDSSVTQTRGVYTGTAKYTCTQQKDELEGSATSVKIGGVDVAADMFGANKVITITIKSDGTAPTIA